MLKPLSVYVVAKKEKAAEKTASGFILPDKNKVESNYIIESVGANVKNVKPGDKIVFKEYSATNVKIGDADYSIIKDEDILATM